MVGDLLLISSLCLFMAGWYPFVLVPTSFFSSKWAPSSPSQMFTYPCIYEEPPSDQYLWLDLVKIFQISRTVNIVYPNLKFWIKTGKSISFLTKVWTFPIHILHFWPVAWIQNIVDIFKKLSLKKIPQSDMLVDQIYSNSGITHKCINIMSLKGINYLECIKLLHKGCNL